MPRHSPLLSGCAKPAMPVFTPQRRKPFFTAASAVAPACALAVQSSTKAPVHKIVLTIMAVFPSSLLAATSSVSGRLSIFRYERSGKSRQQFFSSSSVHSDQLICSTRRCTQCGEPIRGGVRFRFVYSAMRVEARQLKGLIKEFYLKAGVGDLRAQIIRPMSTTKRQIL